MSNERDIPILDDQADYCTWKKKVEIWKLGTNAKPNQQAAKLIMHMRGKPQEVAINIDPSKIGSDTGVKALTDELDALYKKDTTQSLFKAIDSFENYNRQAGEDIDKYISEFQRRYKTLKQLQKNQELYDDVILAYRLLNQASLNEEQARLVRATCVSGLSFEKMQEQLKRTFGDSLICVDKRADKPFKSDGFDFKQEVFYTGQCPDYKHSAEPEVEEEFECRRDENREVYTTSKPDNFRKNKTFHHNNPKYNPYASKRDRFYQRPHQQRGSQRPAYMDKRRLKSPERRCFICSQTGHIVANCPHNTFNREDQQKKIFALCDSEFSFPLPDRL